MGFFYSVYATLLRRLILLLILLHVSVIRPSSCRNILLARITQLATDQLFLQYTEGSEKMYLLFDGGTK
jgi:hypothetical protein